MGETHVTSAEVKSFAEVSCSLTTERTKRNVDDVTVEYLARGYHVSVRNDGISYSEEDVLVIYDSTCVNCSVEGSITICILTVNTLFLQSCFFKRTRHIVSLCSYW